MIVAVRFTLPEKRLTLARLITIVAVVPLSIDRLLGIAEALKPGHDDKQTRDASSHPAVPPPALKSNRNHVARASEGIGGSMKDGL